MVNRVLVTGAAGFIGARFVEAQRLKGPVEIIAVDDPDHFVTRPEHAGVDFGTIVPRDALFDWLAASPRSLSAIVHLGAITDTQAPDDARLHELNVAYSQRLWNYAAKEDVPFVYASSGATYGDGAQGYDDDESRTAELQPMNPYGRSKLTFDRWALEEERRGSAPPAWSGWKFFNVYGFGERHKGRMSSVILPAYEQLQRDGVVRLFRSHRPGIADGFQARDFVDVRDVVRVLDFALATPVRRGIRNLGTGRARTFLDLARAVCRAAGRSESIAFVDMPESLRQQYQYFTEARVERLREAGYGEPFASLEDGVEEYVRRLRS